MIDWRHWHNEPYLVGGLILLGWAYTLFCGPLRSLFGSDLPYPKAKAIAFYSALVIFYLAVGSPLDQVGERYLLSAHMIQHQLLLYPAAILFLCGLPSWLFSSLLRSTSRQRFFRLITHPISCALIYISVLSAWHVPAIYDWALQDKIVHVIEHLMFFVAALFYWWPLLSPAREIPPIKPGAQILYLLAVTIGMTPLFAFLAFSEEILYPTYEFAPRLFADFDPAEDQLLGAAIMKLGGMAVTFCALAFAFYRWYVTSDSLGRNRGSRPAR
ncbi:MAG TPA: cytochrome c oxidase assembly protein [Opitutaceae bacterium]|nr:cytochrome c oxidase assembly protein [Opitutaceae bacterium]